MPRQLAIPGTPIGIIQVDGEDYFSLTDIAKFRSDDPNMTIRQWISTKDTLAYLAVWEGLNNPDFDYEGQLEAVEEAGSRAFSISPTRWIEVSKAKGIVSKTGRNGGTHAHIEIALEFASYISPSFRFFINSEYRRLKQEEAAKSQPDWKLNREIAKINNRIQTDAIKHNLIPEGLSKEQEGYKYANEMDLLNVVVFGRTAKQWQRENPGVHGNMRDNADLSQLLVLNNLLGQNASLIEEGIPQNERMQRLRKIAVQQLKSLEEVNTNHRLAALDASISGDKKDS